MDNIANASAAERLRVFRDSAVETSIPVAMIEKDFWVCWILWKLFEDNELKAILRFKGGTSLSKGYNLIERFSEDLDIILAKELIVGSESLFKPSYTQQREFSDKLSARAAQYISTTLKDKIVMLLGGNSVTVYTDEEYAKANPKHELKEFDNKSLHLVYPKAAEDSYLRPDILLEIGIMSAWTPNEPREILPYIAKAFPNLEISPAIVPTIVAKRTFWDKATILHREYYRPKNTHTPARYSRHYYDLYQMGLSFVRADALADFKLLAEVVERKDKLYHCPWAKYEEVLTGGLHLLPNENNLGLLSQDYKAMQGMIFGSIPEWNRILSSLYELEVEINGLIK
jgi:hypothetical protein